MKFRLARCLLVWVPAKTLTVLPQLEMEKALIPLRHWNRIQKRRSPSETGIWWKECGGLSLGSFPTRDRSAGDSGRPGSEIGDSKATAEESPPVGRVTDVTDYFRLADQN